MSISTGGEAAGIGCLVMWFLMVLGGFVGWCMNVVAVYYTDFSTVEGYEILRCIGIPVPFLGAVLGWL